MKRSIIYIILSMFVFSCKKEKLEPLKPYVYFADNIDYFVVDMDNPPASHSIIGSMSAQAFLTQVKMGDLTIEKDEIGSMQTKYMFNVPIAINNASAPFNVNFSCVDENTDSESNTFQFLMSKPIETYTVTLGAQNNSNYGFYFSFKDQKTYSVSQFKDIKDKDEGFCLGYDKSNEQVEFLSPTSLITNNILDIKGNLITSFCEIVAIDNQPFTKALFDGIKNDAFMRNMNGAEYRTFSYTSIKEDKAYLVKTQSGMRGVIYVQNIKKGVAGSADFIIKLQQQ